jgi:hypothetical protein
MFYKRGDKVFKLKQQLDETSKILKLFNSEECNGGQQVAAIH